MCVIINTGQKKLWYKFSHLWEHAVKKVKFFQAKISGYPACMYICIYIYKKWLSLYPRLVDSYRNETSFQIRLVGGNNRTEGRVEILYNNTWGTVCDDSWDIRDAQVVCRQLGFDRALQAVSYAQFGQGTGRIWLDDVACFGNELTLAECLSSPIGQHNCRHSEDAGVRCYCELVPCFSMFLTRLFLVAC